MAQRISAALTFVLVSPRICAEWDLSWPNSCSTLLCLKITFTWQCTSAWVNVRLTWQLGRLSYTLEEPDHLFSVYFNSLLANLNARNTIRENIWSTTDMITTIPLSVAPCISTTVSNSNPSEMRRCKKCLFRQPKITINVEKCTDRRIDYMNDGSS